jgi:hypothetical protein
MYTGPHIVTDGLVFDISAGSTRSYAGSGTTAYDLVGSTNAGLVNGVGFSTDNGGTWDFDGVDDYMATPSTSAVAFGTGDFTIEVMTKPAAFGTYTHMVSLPLQSTFSLKATSGSGQTGGVIYFYSPSFTTFGSTSGWNLTLNQWNSVVLVRRSGVAYCYLNGELMGSKSGFSNSFTSQAINIGWGWASEFEEQQIPFVRIYNTGLTDAEVLQNFNAVKNRFGL